jgi:hypothetical protein
MTPPWITADRLSGGSAVRPYAAGDRVRITIAGQTVTGSVVLASQNGRSLAVTFEAVLAGAVGMLPILQNDDGSWRDIMGRAVDLETARGND